MLTRLLCCLVTLLTSTVRIANAQPRDYLVDVWDTDRGLPSSRVTSLAQTPEGYLWVATQNGLLRFDGLRFVVFDPDNTPQLPHARVEHLFVDAAGTLWINTYDGSITSWHDGVFRRKWIGTGPRRFEAFLAVSNAEEIFVESIARGYALIKELRPDLVVLFTAMNDEESFRPLSMLAIDRDTSGIPVVTYGSSLDRSNVNGLMGDIRRYLPTSPEDRMN